MWPNDDTGNVLADMADAGIDLSKVHSVVFFQLFEQKEQGQQMVDFLKANHSEIESDLHPDQTPNVWDVDCTIEMIPTYDAIVSKENELEKIASKFKGYNDGWGIEA